ncbi:MAG: single-stranded-DNA-specific exonuclease RecJ [Cyclobacteriaceae bacterium]|jgi:single-stranded-DNA-specific exonuclease|nr:single-stranded-DNA-specific exonuclease RecJ [Cytophagales bacterium]MCZ8327301.1 single-stranded-DNA-specific exonuclease RecJ [Cyclobacteriaceae bacterium]
MNKRWLYKPLPENTSVELLSKTLNVNTSVATILLQRQIDTFDKAKAFFRPSLNDLYPPTLMCDMVAAVERLHKAIINNEKILIYGDYDVDGTTAVALVYSYLHSFYKNCSYYIPDRYTEGYGVSEEGILYAAQQGYSLVITLDCGIKASDKVELATTHGIDFIICDHHLPDTNIPNAVAVLDPKREDCQYPFTELSGCGIGFKLMQGYAQRFRKEEEVFEYLDLVAVSIASDIVPIIGENRILAHFGLIKLNQNPSPGLKALKQIAGIQGEMDINSVVFTIGPRINAAGRIAHANGAVELLIASEEKAEELAMQINAKNMQRRDVDKDMTQEALAMIEASDFLQNSSSTVLYKETWSKGVIGIVASRCIEKYYRPTVILTESNGKLTGSARSVHGFDLYEAIEACGDLLEKFGGHKHAAGLTLDPSNLNSFIQRFEETVKNKLNGQTPTPVLEIDLQLPLDSIQPKFLNLLKQMAPFGPENMNPVFVAKDLQVCRTPTLMKEKHLRFTVKQRGGVLELPVVAFDFAHCYENLTSGKFFEMAFVIEENKFRDQTTLQIRARDFNFPFNADNA